MFRAFTDAHRQARSACKSLEVGVNGRDARKPAEVKLVDGMWTENQRRHDGAFPGLTLV